MKRLRLVIVILLMIAVADLLFPATDHAAAIWQHWPAGYSLFGFLGCLLLIVIAKALAKAGLLQAKRPKGNYVDE